MAISSAADFMLRIVRAETASTFVQASGNAAYPPGSRVGVDGFPAVAPFRPLMRAARVRMVGKAEQSAAIQLNRASGIRPNLHCERVTLDCEFLAKREGLEETILQCRCGDTYSTISRGPTRMCRS